LKEIVLRLWTLLFVILWSLVACAEAPAGPEPESGERACRELTHKGDAYTVCAFSMREHEIRLFHSDAEGEPYRQFTTLERELDEQAYQLIFAMNGGMYHEDRSPVGFYRDEHGDKANVNTNDGPGNFHLKPNGVFWIARFQAGVYESQTYLDVGIDPIYATQSGPMLVINGELHPGLNPDGTSRRRRNGVGVSEDGFTVYFAISDSAVTFHDFATLFRDEIGVPNALFLDGQVSRIFAPEINRNEVGSDLGPIVAVVE
jgi:uncharacterized protein YigE (DUF2233 family)